MTTVPVNLARKGRPVPEHFAHAGPVPVPPAGHSFGELARTGLLPAHFGRAGPVAALLSAAPVVGHFELTAHATARLARPHID